MFRRLASWFRLRRIADDLDEEMELHRALTEQRLEREGLPPEEARRRSRRALGNVTLAREDARAVWILPSVESIRQDVTFAVRALVRQPGFTVVAVGTLAAGIGLNTALFTIFNALTLRPWPVLEPERMLTIFNMSPRDVRVRGGGGPFGFSLDEVSYFESHARSAHGFIASRTGGGDKTLGEDDAPVAWVSGNYFSVLGVEMAHGRGFQPHEDRLESPVPVAVLSHGYWQRRFGGNPAIVGQEVRFEDLAFTVVGVASPAFTGTTIERVDVWMPLATTPLLRPDDRWVRNVLQQPKNCCLAVSARLAPGATAEQAQTELTLLDRQYRGSGATPQDRVVVRGTQFMSGPNSGSPSVFRPMFGGVLLVLVLACANVGNLLIARGAARAREIAIRLSLGASRTRLVRQLLTESVVLAMLGGVGGLLLASWLPSRLLTLSRTATALQVDPDTRVLAFAFGLAVVSTLFFGLAPALHATRTNVSRALNESTHPGSRLRLRNVLLGVQVCAATVLLISAGLLFRAVHDASTRSLGYSLENLALVTFELPQRGFDVERASLAARQVAADLSALVGSGSAVLTSTSPLAPGNIKGTFHLPGRTDEENNAVYEISPGYFELLGLPLVAGRGFTDTDVAGRHVIINESMARQFWSGRSALGQRIVVEQGEGGWNTPGILEIVGVARDASMTGIGESGFVLYQPFSGRSVPQVIVRASDRAAIDAATAAARRADSRIFARTRPLVDNVAPRVRSSRVAAILAGALGGLALVLASVGMFGVFAYWVQQRTREIGVRMALGARGVQVVALVLRASVWTVVVGGLAGAAGAVAASGLLRSYLFGLNPIDPAAYLGVVVLLAVSATFATYIPARRATRIDPVVALRAE